MCVVVEAYIPPPEIHIMSNHSRTFLMRSFRLLVKEREYLQELIDEAVESVQLRDTKLCTAYVVRAVKTRALTTLRLRPVVVEAIEKAGKGCLPRMIHRHAAFTKLPFPLRGKALTNKAVELGLMQRTMAVRVDTRTIKEECELAEGRYKMRMGTEVGQACKKVIMLKTKRRNCVQGIIKDAVEKGVADITRVWRDFQSCTKTMVDVCLEAIAAVATLKFVYVLDIHKLTCLFHLPVFTQVLELLTPSHIFAINMGEDAGVFRREHFELLASKIRDGSSAIRRWYVELGRSRRKTVVECGLVKHNKPNVFQVARREDKQLWKQGDRHSSRVAWLLAPESAYDMAMEFKTSLQDSTCNWTRACAVREEVESEARLWALATISTEAVL